MLSLHKFIISTTKEYYKTKFVRILINLFVTTKIDILYKVLYDRSKFHNENIEMKSQIDTSSKLTSIVPKIHHSKQMRTFAAILKIAKNINKIVQSKINERFQNRSIAV